jgi:hypothetical protein
MTLKLQRSHFTALRAVTRFPDRFRRGQAENESARNSISTVKSILRILKEPAHFEAKCDPKAFAFCGVRGVTSRRGS